jgi:hypothetical protein
MEIVLAAEASVIPLTPVREDVAGDETTILLFETPTLIAPAPSNDSDPAPATPDDTEDVVLPTTNRLCAPAATVAPDIMMVFDEKPTDIAPLPENDRASGNADDVDDDAPVVLPIANKLRLGNGAEI